MLGGFGLSDAALTWFGVLLQGDAYVLSEGRGCQAKVFDLAVV